MIKYSESFCNQEYNPRARVSNFQELMDAWKEKSFEARKSSPCILDIPYGKDADETFDVFLTPNYNAPCLMFIHGGYWRASDKSEFSFIAKEFAAAGAVVFVVNYALAPRVNLETIIEQIHSATVWIYEHAEDYGGNPNALYLSGHSAGGHLTAMMMTSTWSGHSNTLIQGGLSISGLHDLEPLVHASFLNPVLQLDIDRAKAMSPALKKPNGHIPLWTCVGGDESNEFHRQNQLIAKNWSENFQRDIPMPGKNHFTIMDAMADKNSALHQAVLKMLNL